MHRFKISPNISWYTNPLTSSRERGQFLFKEITGYYHDDYHGGNNELRETDGTVENIITTLKNQFLNKSDHILTEAKIALIQILNNDLTQIRDEMSLISPIVSVIPRAKAESDYKDNQLIFKKAVKQSILTLGGFVDGTDYILRHTNTRTTHLDKSGYGGDGDLPYPGITKKTCTISSKITGKKVILIDDLYTESINIDEDAVQALIDKGADTVVFYALGKTVQST